MACMVGFATTSDEPEIFTEPDEIRLEEGKSKGDSNTRRRERQGTMRNEMNGEVRKSDV